MGSAPVDRHLDPACAMIDNPDRSIDLDSEHGGEDPNV
jgi:hypothetical protein